MAADDDKNDKLEPPAYLMEEVPLPDDEWVPADSGPRDDAPPPDDDWMPASSGPRNDAPPPEELWASSSSSPAAAASRGNGPREFGRGAEVKIVRGKEAVGVVGEIFWWGESKYGEGMRAGVKGPDDTSYWIDEENLGWPDEEIPEEVLEAAAAAPNMGKGDRVRVTSGRDSGKEGVIFWWGESKYGDGMRAGFKTDEDQTIWSDAGELELVD